MLKICPLRLAFSKDPHYRSRFTRGNTFSAMGTASHGLSEFAWSGQLGEVQGPELEVLLKEKWLELVQKEYEKLKKSWSPASVPLPRDWPYFAVTQTRTLRRVSTEINKRAARVSDGVEGSVRIEEQIIDEKNKIAGIPDRVVLTGNGYYVFDLKTGHSVASISDAYRRQLLIYAHLVSLTTDQPLLGVGLITAGGNVIWDHVTSDAVAEVIDDVVKEVDIFRRSLSRDDSTIEARPSVTNCRYCAFRGVCQQYWEDSDPEWHEYRGVIGRVVRVSDNQAFTVEQMFPGGDAGQLVGISNCAHTAQKDDVVSVVDGKLTGQSLRGSWYTRVTKLGQEMRADS